MTEFLNDILFLLQRFNWSDVLDIFLVTVVFSSILILLRDTEAMVLLRGVFLIIVLLSLLTSLVDLPAFSWLFSTLMPALIFAIPVIFAPEIRRALERVGRAGNISFLRRTSSPAAREEIEKTLQAIVKAAGPLSKRHHGALIVLQRGQYMTEYIKTGIPLNARVTPELLLQIFYPNTPLHDGSVIIVDNRVKAASCVMPLSASGVLNRLPERTMGLRHRAALGISEISDAIAVVVSEENGNISIAHNGNLMHRLDTDKLLNTLTSLFFADEVPGEQKPLTRFLTFVKRFT
ncbi:MAG: diadenylate cyclase CdaA, partial [Chloroflexota bacterium]